MFSVYTIVRQKLIDAFMMMVLNMMVQLRQLVGEHG